MFIGIADRERRGNLFNLPVVPSSYYFPPNPRFSRTAGHSVFNILLGWGKTFSALMQNMLNYFILLRNPYSDMNPMLYHFFLT
jgi:hypothetical protein